MAEHSSSDSDDEEYVPEGVPSSPSDVSEGDSEEHFVGGQPQSKSSRRTTRKRVARPRRKRGGFDRADDEPSDGCEGGGAGDNESVTALELTEKEKKDSSRIDDLWASFKQDVGGLSKQSSKEVTSSASKSTEAAAHDSPLPRKEANAVSDQPKTVSIKKTYDFAGEEIEVEKKVQADSEEAKKFFESLSSPSPSSRAASDLPNSEIEQTEKREMLQSGTKRKGSGLSSVLQSLGKKQKLSTLEKSQLDWQRFKTDEGLEDELAHTTKDGYLAKQEFLQRADQRQFELEREERLKRFKRLC